MEKGVHIYYLIFSCGHHASHNQVYIFYYLKVINSNIYGREQMTGEGKVIFKIFIWNIQIQMTGKNCK